MLLSFLISMLGMALLLVALIRRDLGIEDLKERVADLKNRSEADSMTIAEGAKYVASAYAVIIAVLAVYYIVSARRVSTLRRDVELLEEEVQRRTPQARD